MQKIKRDELNQTCIKMTIVFYSIQSAFYAISDPNDNSTSRKISVLLKKSTSLSNFLREVKLPDITFKYFHLGTDLGRKKVPLPRNIYYFLDPNLEEYKFFIHEFIKQKYEIWGKDKQLSKEDHDYLDKYLKIIDQGIDSFELVHNNII